MRSERVFLAIILVSTAFLLNGCARKHVFLPKPPSFGKKGVYHVVVKHQTLYRICKTYGVDIKEVASLNGIGDQSKIQTGQRIFIPGAKKVLKVEIYIDDVVSESAGRRRSADKRLAFLWPVDGPCINLFDENGKERHLGIDIPSSPGAPVRASAAGIVLYSGNGIKGYGNLIVLRHSDEFVTVYAHNQVNLVEEGMRVERSQVIGKVGQTGRASGPHLHFEIRKNNKAVDPLLFLN